MTGVVEDTVYRTATNNYFKHWWSCHLFFSCLVSIKCQKIVKKKKNAHNNFPILSCFTLCLSLFLYLATSPSLTAHAASSETQQNKKESHRVLENQCFQQTSSIKAINQARPACSSLVSCGQQHREPWRFIFIPQWKPWEIDSVWLWMGMKIRGRWAQDTMVTVSDVETVCFSASVYMSGHVT